MLFSNLSILDSTVRIVILYKKKVIFYSDIESWDFIEISNVDDILC